MTKQASILIKKALEGGSLRQGSGTGEVRGIYQAHDIAVDIALGRAARNSGVKIFFSGAIEGHLVAGGYVDGVRRHVCLGAAVEGVLHTGLGIIH